jgi:dienelactone hydrolase
MLALIVATGASLVRGAEIEEVRGFPDLARRGVTFWSDGTRLAGDLTYPKAFADGGQHPCIVLCHGWGGIKAHLNAQIGPRFAAAGYVVFTFDYRGWGESDSRLVVTGEMPKVDDDGNVTVTARAVKQLVDPIDQQEDIDAALCFVEGEPMVDRNRIGIWGSSFGGGHVIWRAAHDDRVKCVVAQVGAMDQRLGLENQEGGLAGIHEQKIKQVRGEIEPVPSGADKPEGLIGTPHYVRFAEFSPVNDADQVKVPVLIIDAELEHYFNNKEHGHKVYMAIKDRVPAEYHELKGAAHYDVYREPLLSKVMELEIPWFDKHLAGKQ